MHQHMKNKINELLKENMRFDGRGMEEFRAPVIVETGISKTAEGSARVTIGETVVLAGVKMEITKPYPDTPNEGTIMVGAELLALSNPEFEPGPPGNMAVELARVVDRGIRESKSLDFRKLCIEPGKLCWIVVIDIVTINDAGNLFDASALAALAALQDTLLPEHTGEAIDYKKKTKTRLPMTMLPVSVTISKIGDHLLIDTTSEEEAVIDARLTISYVKGESLCALQKGGDGALSMEDINKMLELGARKSIELRDVLENAKQGDLAQ